MAASLGGGDGEQGGVEWEWSTTTWKNKLGKLLNTGFQSDVTIILGDKKQEIAAHKIFLQCGSKVLHSKIMKCEGSNWLEFNVQDYESFMKMLKFLYTGTSGATINEALPLLKMATEFEVMELRDECATLLKGKLTRDNILPLFEDAMKYAHKDLIATTLKFIGFNAHHVLKLPGFSNLRLECLIEIIQQDELRVKDEMEVFNAVYDWAKAECERQGLDVASNEAIRKVIDKPLKYVRFPLMDKEQFAMNVATKNLLSTDEAMGLLMCFLVSPENRTSLPQGRFISSRRNFFTPTEGWQISRREPNSRYEFDGALALHETLCFYIEGLYPLELKEIFFPEGILPVTNAESIWFDETCGKNNQWRTPVQVEIVLYESNEEIISAYQALGPPFLKGYSVPIVATLIPGTAYKMRVEFSGKSFCYRHNNNTSCPYSPLTCLIGLKSALTFDASPAIIMDSNGAPLASPPFKIQFERENPKDEMPITEGFIERFVFDIQE